MTWWQYALLGACGGALVEVLTIFKSINLWQLQRRLPTGRVRRKPPAWGLFIDVPVVLALLAIRAPLGAGAAMLFGLTGQIRGAYAAIAFGFAAPSILAQLGSSIPQVASAVRGTQPGEENVVVLPERRIPEIGTSQEGGGPG